MRVAVVHDWLYVLGGAEKVLRSILRCFPGSDLFCLFDVLSDAHRRYIGYEASHTSFLQRMPRIGRNHRLYLPLMPLAIEQLDVSRYDLVISSSSAVAKGVITGPDQLHVSYVHSPMRYAWDLQHQYLRETGLHKGVASWIARTLLHRMRMWDVRTANGVDDYIANSHFVARRVKKIYGRNATVLYPPVSVPAQLPERRSGVRYFLTGSRLVPYKNVGAVIDAFALLPDERLVVVGDGPEMARLRQGAGDNITFTSFIPDEELHRLMEGAEAFVFAAEEDFGIVLVEAQGFGTPVLALERGGARETIVTGGPHPTGMFFAKPEPAEIADAVRRFLRLRDRFDPADCHRNALRFSQARFEESLRGYICDRYARFMEEIRSGSTQHVVGVPALSPLIKSKEAWDDAREQRASA